MVRHRGIQGTHTCKWIPRAVLLSHLPSKGDKGAWRSSRPYLDDHLLVWVVSPDKTLRRHLFHLVSTGVLVALLGSNT